MSANEPMITDGEQTPRIGSDRLDPQAVEAAVVTAQHGGVVTFTGVVRDHDGGQSVRGLGYSAHPDAERLLAELLNDQRSRHPEVAIEAAHRIGELEIGDIAIVVVAASAHRAVAFAACAETVDRIKSEIPIWKHQRFADGGSEWVGLPGSGTSHC